VRICAITPHQLLNNPRIVKEADALAGAGHDVRVVAIKKRPDDTALEQAGVRGRRWRLQTIDIERTSHGRWRWLKTGIRQKAAAAMWKRFRGGVRLAGLAYARTYSETIRAVVAEPTDLIIAHAQPMLAPACTAARRLRCRWGFDCEDILSEEYGEGIDDRAHQALVRYVEGTFIPAADYVTTASALFGPWLADHYGVTNPRFVANVPSLSDAPEALRHGYPEARANLSLYWFSMTIGPQRGIEDAIRALPLITCPVTLHLRGRLLPSYRDDLRSAIAAANVADRVVVHDLVAPDEVVRAAADHDVGLLLSQPCCENQRLWMPNKLYAYMMAGLAVAATTTEGHHRVLSTAPGVGFEYEPGNYVQLAEQLNGLARDPARLRAVRDAAFRAAQTRFNWELEQQRLIDVVAGVSQTTAPRSAAFQPAQA
jgi:glycosyltransferase involved in cell wall biosynthesis